jgi:hypothetical protein
MVKLRQAEGVVKMLRKAWHVRLKNIFNYQSAYNGKKTSEMQKDFISPLFLI